MNKERDRLLKQMEKLARCKANDAVKLAFLDGSRLEEVDGLDLTPLTGFKCSDKGGVEIQLVDRLAALRLLVELSDGQESQQAAEFFQAWERKAGQGEREES
ncbi:XRE family transcriptional regulator [uncultured Flavonifractor sp.]|uniref:XRE family transcriptional regulator n=1 Tax=uncultured Flavonifractor sp. TaxID=1193534 RepID=UPI002619BFB7|nr:XRE family transcriptional regulator [uncultured Flavonifractor sp.]